MNPKSKFAKELATVASSFNSNNQPINNRASEPKPEQARRQIAALFKVK